jgi:hypothetical protein
MLQFLFHFKNIFDENKLSFFNKVASLDDAEKFQNLVDELYNIDWVVFCKKPFKTPYHVVSYLGRYTHRGAIKI